MEIKAMNYDEVSAKITEEITRQKNANRVSAMINAKKKLKSLKAQVAEIESQIEQAKLGNWKPIVGTYEDDLNFDD